MPDLLTAAWVGFDDGTPLRVSSGEAVVPMWAEFMRRAPHSRSDIEPPQGVNIVEVEAATGRVWHTGCGPSVVEVFLAGTEPAEQCTGIWDGLPMLTGFEEPPVLTEAEWAEWVRLQGLQEVQIIEDPDALEIQVTDTLGLPEDYDSLAIEVPLPDSPAVRPPVIDSIPRVEPPRNPPPRRDSVRPPVIIPPPPPPPPVDSIGQR